MPLRVQGHGAHRAELLLVQRRGGQGGLGAKIWGAGRGRAEGARRHRLAGLGQGLDQTLPAPLGEEIRRIDLLQPDRGGEGVGAGADQHDVGRPLHHRAGGGDGMAGGGQAGDGPGGQVRSVHDGGVQLVTAGRGEDRPAPGVEQGIVLHDLNGGLDRIQRRAAAFQHGRPGVQRALQRRAIGRVLLGRQAGPLDHARPAVDRQGPARRGVLGLGRGKTQCKECNQSRTGDTHRETPPRIRTECNQCTFPRDAGSSHCNAVFERVRSIGLRKSEMLFNQHVGLGR